MNADEIVKALRHCYQEDIHGCGDCPLNRHDLCYEANLELSAADLIESLQAQLAESQRRERAAVEDLSTYKDCGFCVHVQDQQYCYKNCQRHVDVDNFRTHPCWQWRGPEEGEPHETV